MIFKSSIPTLQHSNTPISFSSRIAWVLGVALGAALLCLSGCASSGTKPRLSVDAQAEALSHFSMGLLAETSADSATALDHFESAIRIDPASDTLYAAPIAIALREKQNDRAIELAQKLYRTRPDLAVSHLLLGQTYLYSDQPHQAEMTLRTATERFPQDARGYTSLSRFLIGQERKTEALTILQQAKQTLVESNAEVLNILGTLKVDRARSIENQALRFQALHEGISELEESLKIEPDNPARQSQIGFAYRVVNELEKALSAFRKSYELTPGDPSAARQLMDITIQTGSLEEALKQCDRFTRDTGAEDGLWLQYLTEMVPPGKTGELRDALAKYVQQNPDAPVAYHAHLSSLLIDSEQLETAEQALQAARTIYPDDQRLQTVLGYLLIRLDKNEEAYEALQTAQLNSEGAEWIENPFFAFNLMVAAHRSGHTDEATETLSRAYTNDPAILDQTMQALLSGDPVLEMSSSIELLTRFASLQPDATEALYYLSVLQAEQEDYESALTNAIRFEQAAQDDPSPFLNGGFYYQLGAIYERTGQLDEAEKQFRKAIEFGPEPLAAAAKNYVAYMWAEKGEKLEMGLELIQDALKVDPDNAAFIDTLGWIYYMLGRNEDAIRELHRAAEIESTDPTIWEHLGDAYLRAGNREEATEMWKKALEIDPDKSNIAEKIRELNPVDHPAAADTPEDTPRHP